MPIKHCFFKAFLKNENPLQAKPGAGFELVDCSYPG